MCGRSSGEGGQGPKSLRLSSPLEGGSFNNQLLPWGGGRVYAETGTLGSEEG